MTLPDLSTLPGIETRDREPVFGEPWEAQAFAMAVALHSRGFFEWKEWAETLGRVIAADAGKSPYYRLWLEALESILDQKSLVTRAETINRSSEWKAALEATPHGQPVLLTNGKLSTEESREQ